MAKNYVIDGGTGELDVGGNTLANRFDLPEAMIPQNLGQRYNIGGLVRSEFNKGSKESFGFGRDNWRTEKVTLGDKNYKYWLKKLYDENADYSIIQRLRKKFKGKTVDADTLMAPYNRLTQQAGPMSHTDRSNFIDIVKQQLYDQKRTAHFKKLGYLTKDEFAKIAGIKPVINTFRSGIHKGRKFKSWPFDSYLAGHWRNPGQLKEYGAADIYDALEPKKIGKQWFLKTPTKKQIKTLQDFHYGDSWRRGLRSFTIKKIQNIAKNNAFMEKLKAGTTNALSDDMIKKIFGPESKSGPYVIMSLARALKGEVDVPGVEKDTKLGNAIMKAIIYKANHEPGFGKWHTQAYKYAEGQLEKALKLKKGEQGFKEGRRTVSKLFKELGLKDFNVDEIHAMRQGLTNKTSIYSVFSQAIEGRINQNEKSQFDNSSSRRQKRLTKALKSGNLKKARELVTEQDNKIAEFYKDNPGTKGKVKLSAFDLRDPEAVFGKKRWASLHPNVKRAMLESFEKVNLTIDPGKGALTQKEWKDVLSKKIKNKAIKDTALKVLSYGLSLPIVALNQAAGAPIKDIPISEKIPLIGGGDFPMTAQGQVEDITSITDMLSQWDKNRKEKEYYTQVLAEEGTGEVPAYDFATGGSVEPRVEYRDGTRMSRQPPKEKSYEDILKELQIQYNIPNEEGFAVKDKLGRLGDIVDPRNYPYYGSKVGKGIMEAAEFSVRFPGAAGQLIHDVATGPGWKEQGLDFIKNVSPGWGWSEKVGLDSLIDEQVGAMKERGSSDAPASLGGVLNLGADIAMPLGYVYGAAKFAKFMKALGETPDKISDFNKRIIDHLDSTGQSKRDFMTLVGSVGAMGAIKAMGLDKVFKVGKVTKGVDDLIPMVKGTQSIMPKWFPMFIQRIQPKLIYEGDGISTFKGTDDFLPGIEVTKSGDDYLVSGTNAYEGSWNINYEGPRWLEIEPGQKPAYFKGEFEVADDAPHMVDPDGGVHWDQTIHKEVDDILGGNGRSMEEFATGKKIEGLTKGEKQVDWAEGRAQYEADMAREADEGLTKLDENEWLGNYVDDRMPDDF